LFQLSFFSDRPLEPSGW